MKRYLKLLKRLLFPHVWVIIATSLIGFPMAYVSLRFLPSNHPISYVSYIFSAYALTILCVNLPRMKKRWQTILHGDEVAGIAALRRLLYRHKYTALYLDNRKFRAKLALCVGLVINLGYAIFRCITGFLFHSAWFWAIGIYYIILSAIRLMLVRNVRITDQFTCAAERRLHSYKTVRRCGAMMVVLNLAMTGMTVQMIWLNHGYEYRGYMIYVSALYAFYYLISAIVQLVQYAKIHEPIITCAKILSLVGALMSMFALQTAMFSAFDKSGMEYQRMMNTITGGIVCTMVLGMAIWIILWSNRHLNRSRRIENDGTEQQI